MGIWTDLTDRLAAEDALRVHEVVINSSAELISVLDEDERYRLVNDAWCRAFGLRREQVLGRFREEFIPGMVSAERQAALRRCLDERCHVVVREGFGSLNEMDENEEDLLDRAWGLEPNSRLSCQAIVRGEKLVVEIPRYTINHAKERK